MAGRVSTEATAAGTPSIGARSSAFHANIALSRHSASPAAPAATAGRAACMTLSVAAMRGGGLSP